MQRYEYKVVPAPFRAAKVKGLKTAAERFAHALAEVMNALGRDGWEYLRTDTLPCEEKAGLLSKARTATHHMLVFRRSLATPAVVTPRDAAAAPDLPPPTPAAAADPASPRPAPTLSVVAQAVEAAPRDAMRLVAVPPRDGAPPGLLPRLGGATGKGLFRTAPKPEAPRAE